MTSALTLTALNLSAVTAAPPDLPSGFEKLGDEAGWEGHPKRIRHVATGIVLVLIEPGEFIQGSPQTEKEREHDEAQHGIRFTSGFYLGETEVTIAQWRTVMGSTPSELDFADDDRLPVQGVSWYMAKDFVSRLNGYSEQSAAWRLPTESEWEYACRAGTTTPYSFGETITTAQVNFDGQRPYADAGVTPRRDEPVAVRSLPPNAWGLYEMHGNVWEWCEDLYVIRPEYDSLVTAASGSSRVLRGGSYASKGSKVRSAHRDGYPPAAADSVYGLRVAFSPH